MRRRVLGWIAWGAFLFHGGFAVAQSSLDVLEQELNDAKQQHQQAADQVLSTFFTEVDKAMASPDAAVALYQQAGGALPERNRAPVVTEHAQETSTEKAARLALDQANLARLGPVLQLHCGLMHYAALLVVKPDQKGLQNDWVAWLKAAAKVYPQLAEQSDDSNQKPEHKRKKDMGDAAHGGTPPPPLSSAEMKGKNLRESIISRFLAFKGWNDKEQGGWSVQELPRLYRANVLDPLRTSPTEATLAAWDVYIAMKNADEKDNERWNQVVYPGFQFDRGSDDFAVAPSTEKLEGLVNLIKANPTHPQVEDWIARVRQMMQDYRARHGGPAAAAQSPATAPAPAVNPNVSVTTVQQGDMTIITTHTNSAPTNAPPAH